MSLKHLTLLALALALTCQGSAMAEQPGHVTGVGGVFVKSKDPKALAQWYREVLGLDVKPWGGAALPFDAPGHPPQSILDGLSGFQQLYGALDTGVHDQLCGG